MILPSTRSLIAFAVALAGLLCPASAQVGLDATMGSGGLEELRRQAAALHDINAPLWLQSGGLQDALHQGRAAEARTILEELRRKGHRLCIEVRFVGRSRYAPLRQAARTAPPQNLSVVFNECRELARVFGDLVDAWEIENEPEMGYFWGTSTEYAAVLKAAWLGFHRGFAENGALSARPHLEQGDRNMEIEKRGSEQGEQSAEFMTTGTQEDSHRGTSALSAPDSPLQAPSSKLRTVAAPRVLMAPMGLPPGPFFENLAANDLYRYTDGFNFHYYGYAPDFPDLYERWRETVRRTSHVPWWRRVARALGARFESLNAKGEGQSARGANEPTAPNRQPPTRNQQPATNNPSHQPPITSHSSPITLSSALPAPRSLPVFITEYGYGLLTTEAAKTAEGRAGQAEWYREMLGHLRALRPEATMAFRLRATEERGTEFGLSTPIALPPSSESMATQAPAWTGTPALEAILTEAGKEPWVSEPFRIDRQIPPGPVILDLLPGTEWLLDKDIDGYRLPAAKALEQADVTIRVYHFGDQPMSGMVEARWISEAGTQKVRRKTVQVAAAGWTDLRLTAVLPQGEGFRGRLLLAFKPDKGGPAQARLVANLQGDDVQIGQTLRLDDLPPAGESSESHADEIGHQQRGRQGRWLLSDGVTLLDEGERLTFTMTPTVAGQRGGRAEWRLPPDFDWSRVEGLALSYSGQPLLNLLDVEFRAANGNRYGLWRRLSLQAEKRDVILYLDQATLYFYGRAKRPARFLEEKPVSLILHFPAGKPTATYVLEGLQLRLKRLRASTASWRWE